MKDYELTIVFHPDREMNLDPAIDKVKKLSTLNITDEVLRYLLVRIDERKAKFAARRAEKGDTEENVTTEKGE